MSRWSHLHLSNDRACVRKPSRAQCRTRSTAETVPLPSQKFGTNKSLHNTSSAGSHFHLFIKDKFPTKKLQV
jgi:hypothetical protein